MTDVELRLTADVAQATKNVGGFRKEYAELVKAVEKPLRQVTAFRELEANLEGIERQSRSARDRVSDLGNELARTANPSKELNASYRDAVNELRRLERAEGATQTRLAGYRRELQSAGVDTRNLAGEQSRLAQELQKAQAAATADQQLQGARGALGVGEIERSQRQLVQLREQYRLVTADAALSGKQRAEAEANYRRGVSQTLESLRQLRAAAMPGATRSDAQAALKAEADAAREAAQQNQNLSAQRALGVGKIQQTQQALVQLREQYRLVMADSTLSARQRAEAETNYRASVSATLARLRDLRAATQQQATAAERAAALQQQAQAGIRAQAAALGQASREQALFNLQQARSSLGIGRYRELQAELGRLRAQYQQVRAAGNLTVTELAVAQQTLKRRIEETNQELTELTTGLGRAGTGGLAGAGGAVAGLVGGFGVVEAVRGYTTLTDSAKKMEAQLRLATTSQEEFNKAQAETFRIAQENQAPLADVVTLYSRLTPALREVGRGQDDALKIIEAVTKSLRISGATAQETASTIQQFSQALGSGVLRGEEFNTLAESSPRLLRALADGLNVNVGALRAMAAEWQLTADVISEALIGQLPKLAEEAAQLPETFAGASTRASNALLTVVARIDQLSGTSKTAIDLLSRLGKALEDLGRSEEKSKGPENTASALERTVEAANMIARFNPLSLQGLSTLFEVQDLAKQVFEQATAEQTGYEYREGLFDLHNKEMEMLRQRDIQEYAASIAELEKLRVSQIKAAEAGGKKLVAAERKAIAELGKVRDERLKIEQRYQEALSGLGGAGDASYGAAQALKVGAREALQEGDVEGAQRQAQAALKMLQELAAAGENTYGFAGFIGELQAIELAANDIEQTNAQAKIDEIRQKMDLLKETAAGLKDMPVSVTTDVASIEAVRSKIQTLIDTLSQKQIVVPMVLANPEGPIIRDIAPLSQDYVIRDIPALAGGGKLTGPGTGTSDSILMWGSNGEFMQPEASVKYYGQDFMEAIRRRALPRYATGGLIGERAMPSIPSLAPALQQRLDGGGERDFLGDITLQLPGGESLTMAVPRGQGDNLKLLRMKFARTHK